MTDSDPQTPDVHGLNPEVLRSDDNPDACVSIVVVGPAGCVALVHGSIAEAGTKGKVILRVVNEGVEIRRAVWMLKTDSGDALGIGDYLNGVHLVQLT